MKEITLDQKGLDGFQLKCIAVISMLIDHMGAILFPQHLLFRYIGRLAFPIYAFLLAEGFTHTKDKKAYAVRLLFFALISECFFDMAFHGHVFYWNSQNIFFTLFIGFVVLCISENQNNKVLNICIKLSGIFFAELLRTDYGGVGVIVILLFYLYYKEDKVKMALMFALTQILIYSGIQRFAVVSLIPIWLYNGKRGKNVKYVFYAFYPVHLFVLTIISNFIR